MSLLSFLKKEKKDTISTEFVSPITLKAGTKGKYIPMAEIPDAVFSEGILGTCCGVEPIEGIVCAPISGRISHLSNTLHAVGIKGDGGIEVLIHVGLDTVEMKGDGFVSKVKVGEPVEQGEVLLEMDLEKIRASGHPTAVIYVVTNSDNFTSVEAVAQREVKLGDALLRVSK